MPILNIKVDNIGGAGQNPAFIYIETNDTVGQVTSNGYLNDIVSQGIPISELDMAVVSTKTAPGARSTQTGLYTVVFSGGSWTLNSYVGAGGDWDPDASWTTNGDWINNGSWQFNAGFNVNSNAFIGIVTSDGMNITTQADINILSNNGHIDLSAPNGAVFLNGQSASFDVNGDFDLNATGGNLNLGASSGNVGIFAGVNNTSGDLNLGAFSGNIGLFTSGAGTVNIGVGGTGSVNLNAQGANISFSPAGIGMGVNAGSGMNVDNTNGDFSFGASTGSFLIGALANTVDILAGTIMTLTAATQLDIEAAMITVPLITGQTPIAAAPTISLPPTFKYLIIDSANQIFSMG